MDGRMKWFLIPSYKFVHARVGKKLCLKKTNKTYICFATLRKKKITTRFFRSVNGKYAIHGISKFDRWKLFIKTRHENKKINNQ